MKKFTFFFFLSLIFVAVFSGCAKKSEELPCDGKGTISIENKLDSTITINIVTMHNTIYLEKDYIHPFSLTGNAPYSIIVDGPGGYHLDTAMMILSCDNKFLIIEKHQ
ncbi:MAG: hypothetical protein M0P47_00810 [Bacteroidales bacterium]|nr:hypothetical protein [Bacteroidales bacterium]